MLPKRRVFCNRLYHITKGKVFLCLKRADSKNNKFTFIRVLVLRRKGFVHNKERIEPFIAFCFVYNNKILYKINNNTFHSCLHFFKKKSVFGKLYLQAKNEKRPKLKKYC